MVEVRDYFKESGQRYYRKKSNRVMTSCEDIDEFRKFFPVRRFRNDPNYEVKTKFKNYGGTYVQILKNKKTGNSRMTVVKEKY